MVEYIYDGTKKTDTLVVRCDATVTARLGVGGKPPRGTDRLGYCTSSQAVLEFLATTDVGRT